MATNTEKIVVQVIVKGDNQLDKLDKKTGKATKSVGGLTTGMAKMAAGVFAAAQAFRVIGSVIGSAIKTFTSFEFQMAKVRAISGATDGDFKKLSQTAQDLGRTTFFTATQVAELQTNFAKLGFTTKEILNAQEATLLLSTATGTDLARASQVAGSAVRGFGLDASETSRVVDVMTLAFNSCQLDIEKWQTGISKVAPIAAGMNIEIEDAAAIMGTLTDAGIEASIAGTSMRNILLKMKDSSSDLSKFLGFTVNSSVDLSRALNKLSTASDETLDGLVNIRQVAAFSVMTKGVDRVNELTAELRNAGGTAKKASKIISDTLEGAFKRLTSATQGLAIKLSADLGGGLEGLINSFANFINKLTENSEAIANFIRGIVSAVKFLAKYSVAIYSVIATQRLLIANNILSSTSLGTLKRAFVATRAAAIAFKGSMVLAKNAVRGFLISSGIGVVVLAVTELASALLSQADASDESTSANERYARSLQFVLDEEKLVREIMNQPLANTQIFAEFDVMEAKGRVKEMKALIQETKDALDESIDGSEDSRLLTERLNSRIESLSKFKRKLKRVTDNFDQIVVADAKKLYDDAVKKEDGNNSELILSVKRKYLANTISKEKFDSDIELLEMNHLSAMIKINKAHGKDTLKLEDDLLTAKINRHDSELITFKDAQKNTEKIRDAALLEENKRNLLFIQDDTKTKEELEKNAKTHSDKIIEIETTSFNSQIANADTHKVDKIEIEQAFVDFQLENIQIIADAQLESDEETLQKTKEISEQKLSVMKAASDAIFTIMSGNLDKQTERETKKLEEQKDSGLITAEEYEVGVEAIQREAFEKKKRMDIAQAIINGALAMTTVMGQSGLLAFAFSPFIAAMTALQIGVIASQKFAQGGVIEEFANGGMVQGKSHAQGGEKFAVGGRVVELEGGEAVINKRSTSMFSSQLSAMNAAGGGVKFADGGLLNQPSFSQQQFNALGQNQMMGAMGNSGKVTVVEADITSSQNTVSVIQSQATI